MSKLWSHRRRFAADIPLRERKQRLLYVSERLRQRLNADLHELSWPNILKEAAAHALGSAKKSPLQWVAFAGAAYWFGARRSVRTVRNVVSAVALGKKLWNFFEQSRSAKAHSPSAQESFDVGQPSASGNPSGGT